MRVVADASGDLPTVAAICRVAGVSNGTFYNYFDGVDHLLQAVGEDLAEAVQLQVDSLARRSGDPVIRIAAGIRQLVALPRRDAVFARAFLAFLSTKPAFRARVRAIVAAEVEAGVARGVFVAPTVLVASDALLGAVLQTVRSVLLEEFDGDVEDVVCVGLRLLGVPPGGGAVARA